MENSQLSKNGSVDLEKFEPSFILKKPFKDPSDTLFVIFTSRNTIQNPPQFQYLNTFKKSEYNAIYLRDLHDAWYQKGFPGVAKNIDEAVSYLRKILSDIPFRKLVAMGASSGGYAALVFGYFLKANRILAFSPQTLIPRGKPLTDHLQLEGCDPKYFDLTRLDWNSANITCDIFYSHDFQSDKASAERMKNVKNFVLHPFQAGQHHNIAKWLIQQNLMVEILMKAYSQTETSLTLLFKDYYCDSSKPIS